MKHIFSTKVLFLILFGLLYACTGYASIFHSIEFFKLANNAGLATMLACTFEIGQAAVLFSLLTNPMNRKKAMPWLLMGLLTIIQIMGNVYSSYKYLIMNSADNLRFFKEPIFVWMNLPDAQANVILGYLISGTLPLVSLAMTAMVVSYLDNGEDKKKIEEPTTPTKEVETPDTIESVKTLVDDKSEQSQMELPKEEPVEQEDDKPDVEEQAEVVETPKQENTSHFINI